MSKFRNTMVALLVIVVLLSACAPPPAAPAPTQAPTPEIKPAGPVKATPGKAVKMTLLPKFLGIPVFDQTHRGALEAAKELQNPEPLQYLGPTPENMVAGQIEIITAAVTQGQDAIMISNGGGDELVPAVKAAREAGMTVVFWDSPIPSGEGEQLFVAQVDFNETGKVLADMALDILGAEGGKFAVISAAPDTANQNAWIASLKEWLKEPKYSKLQLVEIAYGMEQAEINYEKTLALIAKYPDIKLIMPITASGFPSVCKALQDEGYCGKEGEEPKIVATGLGLPSELVSYTLNGCAPKFALWSFVDFGYLTYYTTYLLATGAIKGEIGEQFEAGRMGTYTIEKDPTREKGLRVLMGPFTIYDKTNIEEAAKE